MPGMPSCQLDEPAQRKLDRLAAVPRAVELLARVVLHADVVHFDVGAGYRLGAVADDQIGDGQSARRRAVGKFDLGLFVLKRKSPHSR